MKSLVSSSDENASDQDSNMDKYDVYSKDNKVCELKDSGYMKKKIISVIKKSLKTNNNKHSLTLNDVSVSEEKEIGNGCRQSLNIRIALDDKLFYSSGDVAAAPINIETFKLNDSTPATTKCCSHCSNKELKSEDTWPAYFTCVKCGRKEQRKWYHENCKEKCCVATSIYCDNCLRFKLTSIDHNFEVLDNKFAKYMYVVTCPNGGGISLHMDYERIMHFTQDEQQLIAKEFLKEAFKEDKKGFAQFTIAIVHNGASYMPDLLKLLSELHPTLPVKTTKLKCNTETEVMDLGTYYIKVKETYSNGTFAFNPLNEIQAASVKNDECGAYLPELLSLLEKSAFLTQVLPWSDMTTKRFKSPHESDDGPIFWCRPGEQIVSLDRNSKRNRWNADEIETFLKERQQNLKDFCEKRYIVEELKKYRRSYSSREFLFEDRTRPHADQVWGNHFECTAAVGVIQAIHPDEIPEQNRACKEIVVFHAKHFEMLEALLHIDVTAAPKQQCAEWLDDAKLNMIRQMNIRYSKLHLYDNDIYFIPRKIVHQFKTISATLSVAWHTRLIEYYLEPDPSPVLEPAEGSDVATTSTAIKKEQLSDDGNDSSSSCSSDSLPPPARKRKAPTATPKKKRKLSCTRSTASTDNEATPRKRKKPRSRSTTPMKRAVAEKTPKKRLQKTPKKALVLDEEPQEEYQEPAPQTPQPKKSPLPEPRSQPVPATPQPTEKVSLSRSSSPVPAVVTKVKKEPRSKSPPPTKRRDSDVSDRAESRKSRSRSPSQTKKLDSNESGRVDVRKSRSKSPSRTNKHFSDGSERDESRKSSSKSPSRSKKRESNEVIPSDARKSRSKSPPLTNKGDSDETSPKDERKSRSKSPSRTKKSDSDVTSHTEVKKSRSKSPSRSKKRDSDERSHSEARKSRSKSPSSTKKRDTNDTVDKEPKKKKKHRPRSRSRSRKHSNTTPPDKDNKTDTSEAKPSSKKKKKDRSRSRSPKKSDKSKDTANNSSTAVKSSKKLSSSKKHDDQPKSSTGSETEKQHHRKKHRSDKDKKSPKRREREKTPTTAPSVSSDTVKEVQQTSPEVDSCLKSPPSSLGSMSTEKCLSPVFASSVDDGSPLRNTQVPSSTAAETEQDNIVTTSEDFVATDLSSLNTNETPSMLEKSPPASPSPICEPEERAPTPPAKTKHIKLEPASPEVPIKKESLESVISSLAVGITDEPASVTAPVPTQTSETQKKDTTAASSVPVAKSVPEKPVVQSEKPPVKKPITSSGSADSTSRKEHRKKEKLWDTPLFMPQDCDKYEWTKRSSGPPVVSNRATITKNGDKIVKQKMLNSIQNNNNKIDERNDTANVTKPARSRSRSRSPPPWIKKKERKQDDDKLAPPAEPLKKSTNSNDKRGNVDKDKSAPSSSSISSEKHRDRDKKSSEHKRIKESGSSTSKKDTERSSTSEKKKSSSSSHAKDKSVSNQSSEKSGKDRNDEKKKRSRSPSEKRHRDKHSSSSSPPHSSSSSKKHKKHRSKSRDRTDPASEKPKSIGASNTEADTPVPAALSAITATSTETVSLKNPQDVELAANYKLMIPRVEIFDIGAKYKKSSQEDASTGTKNRTDDVEGDTADVETTARSDANDRNQSDELNDQSPMETDQNDAENVNSPDSDTQQNE